MPEISTYPQRPPYMHPWGPQMMFSGTVSSVMDSGSQMQYLFHGYQHPQVQSHHAALRPIRNSAPHMLLPGLSINYEVAAGVDTGALQQRSTHSHSQSSQIPSQVSGSTAGEGSASRSVASGDPCRTQSLDSRIPDFVTNMHSHIPHVPYLSSRGNAWPVWRGGSVLLPFDSHVAGMSSPLLGMSSPLPTQETDVNGTTVGECNAISNAGDSRVVRHGESKKTL